MYDKGICQLDGMVCGLLLQPDLLMEAEQSPSPIKRTIQHFLANIASSRQIKLIEEGLLQLPLEEEEPTIETALQGERQAESLPYNSSEQPPQQPPTQTEKEQPAIPAEQVVYVPYQASAPAIQEVQLPQDPIPPSRREQPLTEPPLIAGGRRNATEQSSERSRTNLQSSRKGQRRSSEEESVNLQLTQKTKRSKNMSFTQNKVDSLLYSDATLLYSNDTTGFDREASLKQHQLPLRTQSHNVALKQVEDEGEMSARMERAQSRECQRMPTESQKASEREQRLQTQQEEGNVFQTQIDDYKGKISKIRQLKENKKRKLQTELRRVNQQLEELTRREQEAVAAPKPNNFQSRVKISDNAQAKAKAQRLVGRLHQDKRSRQEMHLGQLQAIDKNINDYMQQLMKERYKNEERIKQRKKLEIIDRMRQQEMRKMEEQQKKDKNLQFIHQLRNSNSKPDLQPQKEQRRSSDHPVPHYQPPPPDPLRNKQRSHTKKSEPAEQTPELSRKKAYLKKIRNISFKKEKKDAYEQLLN